MGVSRILEGIVAAVVLVSFVAARPAPVQVYGCGPSAVKLRDPPTLSGASPGLYWTPPPIGWIFKPWNQVLTSNSQAAQLRNFQWDPTPVTHSDPTGPMNDLSSFQIPHNDTIFTSYGVAIPNDTYVAVLDYRGTGILENATSQYSWLGWGCDGNGFEYYVSYSTAAAASGTPAGIDVMSLVDTGLDQATTDRIVAILKQSENEEIRNIAKTFVPNIQDGGRQGLGRITDCDDECKTNKDLIGIIG
ncbi:hypothetical protein SLS60_009016 [Paraconiothyrium brasiliense]|uniref:Uncharacterized protein n=1 Tax=Paraconiothyrium brasiliense TaxID=300254 RepID=A0ABR3QW27_9PLEO